MTGLELGGITAGYGDREVLHGIDLTVPDGVLLAVLGRSGAGKSTLLRVVAGLEPATSGRVVLAGRDVTALRPGLRNVSMVFQSHALFPHLDVADNIAFGLRVRGMGRSEVAERVQRAAILTGCSELLDRRPGRLSGGERQRIALARALVREPDLFLLDEPMSNLDAESRAQTRTELKALHQRIGKPMVHVTHDQVEALVLGDLVAVLGDGRIEQVGTPDEIYGRPATTFVARFVGSPPMNLLPSTTPLLADSPAGKGFDVGVRPEAIHLGGEGAPAEVVRVDVVGADAHVHLGLGDHVVVARVPLVGRPVVGERVRASVRANDVHLFDADTGLRVVR